MMGAGSKRKGSSFERSICTSLSLWISGGKHDDLLWRSAMSGGRGTRRELTRGAQQVSGDICAVAPGGHVLTNWWHIEAKHVKAMNLTSFALKGSGWMATEWKRCKRQAVSHHKLPMMIVRQNLMPEITLLQYYLYYEPLLTIPQHECFIYLLKDMLDQPYTIPRLPLRDHA
jgi:hypothetical protein